MQSRAGVARNVALRQREDLRAQMFLETQQAARAGDAAPEVDLGERREAIVRQNKAELQRQVVEQVIITAEDVLPIFHCIHQRVQMEKLLQQNNNDQIVAFFKQNKLGFSPASAMEAKQCGEEYYNDLKRRYANLLKSTPQVVADSLVNNEFVYLTYDSPEVRRVMIKQFLEKTTDMEGVYDNFDPNINIY